MLPQEHKLLDSNLNIVCLKASIDCLYLHSSSDKQQHRYRDAVCWGPGTQIPPIRKLLLVGGSGQICLIRGPSYVLQNGVADPTGSLQNPNHQPLRSPIFTCTGKETYFYMYEHVQTHISDILKIPPYCSHICTEMINNSCATWIRGPPKLISTGKLIRLGTITCTSIHNMYQSFPWTRLTLD